MTTPNAEQVRRLSEKAYDLAKAVADDPSSPVSREDALAIRNDLVRLAGTLDQFDEGEIGQAEQLISEGILDVDYALSGGELSSSVRLARGRH
jgi:hypothetical protein